MSVIDQYQIMHRQGHFPGHSLKTHIPEIKRLLQNTMSQHMLDYGCGKAMHHREAEWGIPVQLYDPAVLCQGIDKKPVGDFDFVICTDVLEHIPENEVRGVVDELFDYANKYVFMTVCTRPAKKTLPDGRNAHLTVRPEKWWRDVVGERPVPYTLKFMD